MRALLVDSSVKHVARAAMDYADFRDGSSCHPSNERLARETGYSERTVRDAWGVMRELRLAERVSHAVSYRGKSDEYRLCIPDGWAEALPLLGPRSGPFICQYCGDSFNPRGNSELQPGGKVVFKMPALTFCPPPRSKRGRQVESCHALWWRQRAEEGKGDWSADDAWELFRKARDDDW
ncbi:hypothetical protein AB0M72_15665 [Nocardiopsis dassonvillei]